MSKRSDGKDEPPQRPYASTKCSKTCTAQPCIAGPSSLTRRTPSSPPSSSSRTAPPSLSPSADSLLSTAYYSKPRKMKSAPEEYPRRSRSGKVDKGKKKASDDENDEGEKRGSGRGVGVGVGTVGGRHMMNYTGLRKKSSHDRVAQMRDQAAQSNASMQLSSQTFSETETHAAPPRLGQRGPGSTCSRRDSMEPEARHSTTAQSTLATRSTWVLGRKRTQDLKEKDKEKDMASNKMWKFVKRAWTGLGQE